MGPGKTEGRRMGAHRACAAVVLTGAALAAAPAASTGPEPWAGVIRHLESGDPAGALTVLSGVAHDAPGDAEIAGWLHRQVAEAALGAGDAAAAQSALSKIPDWLGPGDLPLRLARLESEAGRVEAALAVLADRAVLPAGVRPAALALEAALLEAKGDRLGARQRWSALHFDHPGRPEAQEAWGRFLDLSEAGDPMPDVEAILRRVEALEAAHHNDAAIEAADDLARRLPGAHPLACRLGLALGSAHRKARNYREAIEALGPLVEGCEDAAVVRDALWLLASATWILEGDPAIPLYERFSRRYPDHPDADRALYLVAALHQREGRLDAARSVLEAQIETFPDGRQRFAAAWRRFWIDFLDGRPADGRTFLEGLVAGAAEGSTFHAERARYWQARVLEDAGDAAGAADAYAALAKAHPLSYYWLMAVHRLREIAPERADAALRRPPPAGSAQAATGDPLAGSRWVRAGDVLLALGLPKPAGEAYRAAEAETAERGPEALVALALRLSEAGDDHRAHWVIRTRARGFDDDWPVGEHARVWRAAYPRAYAEAVTAAAEESGIDPLLLHAIVREESAILPGAVSWAGAVGLAQMMPRTAADVAGRLGLDPARVDREALKDPVLNLRIAARHLADLKALFGGDPVLAIAAYNAGERTVMGWALDAEGMPVDAFVESIRIAETQRYSRRVIRSWATYRWLYGEPATPPISLPSHVRVR